MLKNNLISLLDMVFPSANRLFASPAKVDGTEKWVDFVDKFWHCGCVSGLSENAFIAKFQKWCGKYGYYFSVDKACEIHRYASACVSVLAKANTTKFLIKQAVSSNLAALRKKMQDLASTLPEYFVIMEKSGVGPALGPQLMAEIGDVRRFKSKKSLVAFTGIYPPPYQSGTLNIHSRSISKRGSPALRRTLFLVMTAILIRSPADEPVYQFMDNTRSEGKPYKVYMMASANKFLRIYYASVKSYLDSLQA